MITKIYETELLIDNIYSINTGCINSIILSKEKHEETRKISNYGGWQSNDHLQKDMRFSSLVREIGDVLNDQLKPEVGYEDNIIFSLSNMWANVNRKGNFNEFHIHPTSMWSFCYYTNVPEDSGDVSFRDPRIRRGMMCDNWARKEEYRDYTFIVRPEAGMLIVFPSYLEHAVLPSETEEPRISVSGNIDLQRRNQNG